MVAGAVLCQGLFSVAGDDLDLDAGLPGGLLDGFRDAGHRLDAAHVHGDTEAVGQSRLGQQFLRLGHVQLVGVLVQRAQHALWQEGLPDFSDALDQSGADRVIVDQPLERLAHFRLGERGVLLVEADVVDRALRSADGGKVGILGDGIEIARLEVARHIDVALFEHQALGGALLDVPIDDARQFRLVAVVIVVALHHHDLVGAPLAQLECAGTSIVGLQPVISEVVVELVFIARRDRRDMLLDQLAVDDRGDRRRQAVQHEAGRIGLVDREDKGGVVGGLGLFRDVLAGQAELLENEGRALVELDGALERPGDIGGRQRVAGSEFQAGLQLERVGQAVVGHGPALGKIALDLGRVIEIEPHQKVVGVAGHLRRRQFESLTRVHGYDVVDGESLDQRVGGRLGESRHRGNHHRGKCGARKKEPEASVDLLMQHVSPLVALWR